MTPAQPNVDCYKHDSLDRSADCCEYSVPGAFWVRIVYLAALYHIANIGRFNIANSHCQSIKGFVRYYYVCGFENQAQALLTGDIEVLHGGLGRSESGITAARDKIPIETVPGRNMLLPYQMRDDSGRIQSAFPST
jgi:hypothetical protein